MPTYSTGDLVGRLTLLSRSSGGANIGTQWLCRCECGNERVIRQSHLGPQGTRSCGCLHKDCHRKHGCSPWGGPPTKEYRIWSAMITRCTNPRQRSWKYYGGRGIRVCDRWRNDFTAFLSDMGHCPDGLSLDRVSNDGNYEPDNCRWATSREQRMNQRRMVGAVAK